MENTQVTIITPVSTKLVEALMYGNLKNLSKDEKVLYYRNVCESVGLNPLTKPFQFMDLKGKEILYAGKECTEQLRKVHKISINIVARELKDDIFIVTARAKNLTDGREDESTGAVCITGLKGEDKANAFMKAETKAKRRVTLSICGLGMLDESEVETIAGAKVLPFPDDQPPVKKEEPPVKKEPEVKTKTSRDLLIRYIEQMSKDYDNLGSKEKNEVFYHFIENGIHDVDLPMLVRQHFDNKYKLKKNGGAS